MQRKLNLLLLLFSLLGGAVGYIIAEIMLNTWGKDWPRIVAVGLYFGVLALCIGLGCLIAEVMSPRLNGPSWKQRYAGTSWKLLVPATLVMIFVLALALEFVYEINGGGTKPVKDIALVIDNSGSMTQTDPDNERYAAAKNMIDRMDGGNRVAVLVFNDQTTLLQPFAKMKNQAAKDEVTAKIDALEATDGGTDIGLALSDAMKQIEDEGNAGRGTMVVLLSDGASEVDLNAALAPYKQKQVQVNTIGLRLMDPQGSDLLKAIAQETGGQYYDVQNAGDLSPVFQKIYRDAGERTLLTERTGPQENSTLYLIARVVFLALIGAGIGIALGLIFDNRYLARSFGAGGTVSGLLAGLLLEFGLTGEDWIDSIIRLLACLVLAGVLAVFTAIVPVKENGKIEAGLHRPGQAGRSRNGFAGRNPNSNSRGF